MTCFRFERPPVAAITLGVTLATSLVLSSFRSLLSWQRLSSIATQFFLTQRPICSQISEASANTRSSEDRSRTFDDVKAAVGLLICSYSELPDIARFRQCQRDLDILDPRHIASQLASMKLYNPHAQLTTIKDIMQGLVHGSPAPTFGEVIQACFNEAVCRGSSLHEVLQIPDAQGRAPVQSAVQKSMHTILRALLTLGAPADLGGIGTQFSWSPLMYAVSVGDNASASLLVSHGASVNFVETQNHWTPLMVAIANNHLGMVEWLLDSGANPEGTFASLRVNQHIDDCRGCIKMLDEIIARRRIEGRGLKHYASHGARGRGRA